MISRTVLGARFQIPDRCNIYYVHPRGSDSNLGTGTAPLQGQIRAATEHCFTTAMAGLSTAARPMATRVLHAASGASDLDRVEESLIGQIKNIDFMAGLAFVTITMAKRPFWGWSSKIARQVSDDRSGI